MDPRFQLILEAINRKFDEHNAKWDAIWDSRLVALEKSASSALGAISAKVCVAVSDHLELLDAAPPATGTSSTRIATIDAPFSVDGDAEDFISSLLVVLLCDIMSRLPTKDAARAAVLSRYWLRVWVSRPIVLDDSVTVDRPTRVEEADAHVEDADGITERGVERILEHSAFPASGALSSVTSARLSAFGVLEQIERVQAATVDRCNEASSVDEATVAFGAAATSAELTQIDPPQAPLPSPSFDIIAPTGKLPAASVGFYLDVTNTPDYITTAALAKSASVASNLISPAIEATVATPMELFDSAPTTYSMKCPDHSVDVMAHVAGICCGQGLVRHVLTESDVLSGQAVVEHKCGFSQLEVLRCQRDLMLDGPKDVYFLDCGWDWKLLQYVNYVQCFSRLDLAAVLVMSYDKSLASFTIRHIRVWLIENPCPSFQQMVASCDSAIPILFSGHITICQPSSSFVVAHICPGYSKKQWKQLQHGDFLFITFPWDPGGCELSGLGTSRLSRREECQNTLLEQSHLHVLYGHPPRQLGVDARCIKKANSKSLQVKVAGSVLSEHLANWKDEEALRTCFLEASPQAGFEGGNVSTPLAAELSPAQGSTG